MNERAEQQDKPNHPLASIRPQAEKQDRRGTYGEIEPHARDASEQMTVRAEIAKHALVGLLAGDTDATLGFNAAADSAVQYADALIDRLNQ